MIYTTTIMRLLFPPISLLLALGIPIVNGFTIPQTTAPSGGIANQNTFDSTLQRKLLYTSYASTTISTSSTIPISTTKSTALYAKKKKGNKKLANAKDAALAALEAIEAQEASSSTPDVTPQQSTSVATLDFLEDEPLSKKEQMALQKKQQKEAKKQQKEQERLAKEEKDEIEKNKRKKALKALAEMEAAEKNAGSVNNNDSGGDDSINGGVVDGMDAPLSKKEQKMAMKKAAKDAEKQEKKAKKKRAKQLGITVAELEEREANSNGSEEDEFALVDPGDVNGVNGVNGAAVDNTGVGDAAATSDSPTTTQEPPKKKEKKQKLTAEERIRKERPPPRIRIMESSQPDYTALRLENIAITFRDQPVLKSATWGVQTGDRIGLVGANGAGKTTQLRILSGELEPTAGDVIKSTKDLRVAMLRQEFIDEIVLTRTLREEFMSVFVEENQIMEELAAAEKELEGMSGDANDADQMQEVLDRMQKLQGKADAKNVNALGARVSKIMDLMGFEQEEGEYEVNMFSGGWKMRIGLGKVLLQGKLDM